MPLTSGSRLGPYEIAGALGAGGMGEVYRARDTKLGRDVAIKVLPQAFASDPERLGRFEREARTLASLNHPNIAAIYGIEEGPTSSEQAGLRALVMELVEGRDLSAIIAAHAASNPQRRGLPLAEALPIARQIADALAAAHEAGIIHRDLKPANVKVREDGTVKVLDFGLAKAMGAGVDGDGSRVSDQSPSGRLANSPTLTARATEMGMILGTAAYMAPEQARGKSVDRRADVWAFGVVLLEMLIGRRVFDGSEVTDVLAAVIKDAPPLDALPENTPAPIRRLLRRCLEKDRAKRLDSMINVRLEIDDALQGVVDGAAGREAAGVQQARAPRLWQRPAFLTVAALILIAASVLATSMLAPPPLLEPVTRVVITAGFDNNGLALSRDGRMLAFQLTDKGGGTRIYVRRRDEFTATPIAGTEGGFGPFFSPNGLWLGFFTANALKKVNLTGGPAVTICATGFRRGAVWTDDGRIVFASGDAPGLRAVPEAGGEPVDLTTPGSGEGEHYWPSLLPNGLGVLFTISKGNSFKEKNINVLSFATGTTDQIVPGSTPVYLPSGHLVFGRESSLWAAPFDLATLKTTAEPAPIVEDVMINAGGGWGQYAVSPDGTLAYRAGSNLGLQLALIDGAVHTPIPSEGRVFDEFRVSPNGATVAVEADGDVWTLDLARGAFTRITTTGASDPIWAPGGKRITAVTAQGIQSFPADGAGKAETITPRTSVVFLGSWSPDGRVLAYESQSDLWTWSADTGPKVWYDTPTALGKPEFSPDGRWLAYASAESGIRNVYVRPFPGPGSQLKVSLAGGSEAAWARDGKRLFFRQGADLKVVRFDPVSGNISGQPEPVFPKTDSGAAPAQMTSATGTNRYYDVMPDGRRFVVLHMPNTASSVHVVYNWVEELKKVVK